MSIITWVVMGLIVGVVAKFVMPGTGPSGIISTIIIGIVGAMLGGFIGTAFGLGAVRGFDPMSFLLALAGAIVALFLFRAIRKRKP